jgi:hypothetical protein
MEGFALLKNEIKENKDVKWLGFIFWHWRNFPRTQGMG